MGARGEQQTGCQIGKSKECKTPSPAVSDRSGTAAGADKAHLSDRRLVPLAGGRVDESSCKERFEPQIVVQDHLEQGPLTGRQLGSDRVCNTAHLTHHMRAHSWKRQVLNCRV